MENSTWKDAAGLGAPPETYDPVAKTLHALMALAILAMFAIGTFMVTLAPSMAAFRVYDLHKSIGLTLFVLAVLRLGWRLYRGAPEPLEHGVAGWELALARIVHVLLYTLMICVPIIGWLGASASGLPMTYFGLMPIPRLIAPSAELQALLLDTHRWANWSLMALLVLHIGGALKRHFVLRDDTLVRMIPFVPSPAKGKRPPQ